MLVDPNFSVVANRIRSSKDNKNDPNTGPDKNYLSHQPIPPLDDKKNKYNTIKWDPHSMVMKAGSAVVVCQILRTYKSFMNLQGYRGSYDYS